jgi:hypothetical protein
VTITEIMPAIQTLSRSDKYQLARLLIDSLADEDSALEFKEGHVYPIYTPEYAPHGAAQLVQRLGRTTDL